MTKNEFTSEFLARTLDKKFALSEYDDMEKEQCNNAYAPNPYDPNEPKYPYFEAWKEGYRAAVTEIEGVFVSMMNEVEDITKD